MLAFSNAAFAAGGIPQKDLGKVKKPEKQQFENVIKMNDSAKEYAPNDEVRVIVELKEEPVIYSAESLGKSYHELSESNKEKLRTAALDAQERVKNNISENSIKMEYEESFTTIYNGFSGKVNYKSIKVIESLPNVGKVHITNEYTRPTEEPKMLYSKELVNAQKTWQEYGYKGEGITIGVIDTGIDPSHQDMILSEKTDPEISKEDVTALKDDLAGKYFTEKVPYGYNYADENNEVLDLGPEASMHGMHVSGTVGANGDEDNGGIKGIAPEAQILGLKVFGNDPEMPSTYSDIYIKAIDDAIILGADVINMSLGSTASFVLPEDPEQQAIKRAVENGVMMAISAGNSAKFGEGFADPYASNPDIGVVGAPGLASESLQVAAFENKYLNLEAFDTTVDGEAKDPIAFLSAGNVSPEVLGDTAYEVVYAGLGRMPGDSENAPDANDFEGLDLEGKIALIQRGESAFVDKAMNAQEHGAVGVIIFNNVSGYVSMATDDAIEIPQLFILKQPGEELKGYLEAGKKVEIAFNGKEIKALNPENGKMATFSSWGTTPSLDFKPEITAPGASILSTLQDDEYGMMSGTSMAAPHVAGGSALVMQRVEEAFNLAGADRVEMTKNILMNTSRPQIDKGLFNDYYQVGLGYSPRLQGAGLMDLHAAMSTPVTVTAEKTGLAKVALKEIDKKTNFTLEVNNFSDENVIYTVDGTVQTDLVNSGSNAMETQGIYKAGTISGEAPFTGEFPISITSPNGGEVDGEYQIVVPANETVELNVTIDLENTIDWFYNKPLEEIFENGHFVEGFITLTDPNDSNPEVNVPYVGFHGEWDEAPVLDDLMYEEDTFYGVGGLVTPSGADFAYLGSNALSEGVEESKIAFSPDGDDVHDSALPVLSFLRNAKDVKFKILNEDEEELKTIRTEKEVRKHYYDGGLASPYTIFADSAWNGKVSGETVEDGLYYYEIETVIDYPDAEWQSKKIPVLVDTKDPTVEVTYDEETGKVSWVSEDEGAGISHYEVLVNGESVLEQPLAGDAKEYTLEGSEEAESIKVVAHDWAGNAGMDTAGTSEDETIPYITVLTPEALSVHDTKEIAVTGYVKDESAVKELFIDGNKVEIAWDEENSRYAFSKTLTYKTDGLKEIEVSGTDAKGNDISFIRRVMLDTTKASIDVAGPFITNKDTVDLDIALKDNYSMMRFYINDSEKYYKEFREPYEMVPFTHEYTETLKLKDGTNRFNLKLVDIAGNETTKKITVIRSDEKPKNFDDISENYWAKDAIEMLNVMGVINGYTNGDFGKDDEIKRVHAAQMLVRALDLDTSNVKDPGFKDVKKGDYGYEDIAAIAEAGIMTGTPAGKFLPESLLTRAEMSKILVEAYDMKGSEENKFTDVPDYWATDYINTLVANNITVGYPDGTFKPNGNTTRAEFALMLARSIDDRFKK
nr:S8 family serine peptidase [Thalassobacillus pellis]